MSKKTLFVLVALIVAFAVVPDGGTVIFAQNTQKEPSFGQKIKNAWQNFLKDDGFEEEPDVQSKTSNRTQVQAIQAVSTPMQPPKPLTAAEIKQATDTSAVEKTLVKVSPDTQRTPRRASPTRASQSVSSLDRLMETGEDEENDENLFNRLREKRQRVITAKSLEPADPPLRSSESSLITPSNSGRSAAVGTVPKQPVAEQQEIVDPFLNRPQNTPNQKIAAPAKSVVSEEKIVKQVPRADEKEAEKQIPSERKIPTRIARSDVPKQTAPTAPVEPLKETNLNVNIEADNVSNTSSTDSSNPPVYEEKSSVTVPRLELTTEGPPKTNVGQEAVYRIRITNAGNASAEQVVLSTEIPEWVEIRAAEVTGGKSTTTLREENLHFADLTWKINRIDAGKSELMVLRLVPKQRKTVDLRIKYDFYKPSAVTKITVQEPVLSMELQGPDEVLWSSIVDYTLVVRNTGNGDAEDVSLELLQTDSERKTCSVPLIQANKEQLVHIQVETGKQEYIDIVVQANGKYDLKSKIERRITVRRPSLELRIDAPTVQFVGNAAEFGIYIRNNGDAAAKDFEVKATLPLGTQYLSATDKGSFDEQKNCVIWNVPSLGAGESFNAKIQCNPKSEGKCNLEAVVTDKGGELASGSGNFTAEAIVQLKLEVENPTGPVETGTETTYTVHVKNTGTKVAENVEVAMAFDSGLEPLRVEGCDAGVNNGLVVFDKIPSIPAGQELTLKVVTKSHKGERIRVKTEVVCQSADVHLVDEHATYFYDKKK